MGGKEVKPINSTELASTLKKAKSRLGIRLHEKQNAVTTKSKACKELLDSGKEDLALINVHYSNLLSIV